MSCPYTDEELEIWDSVTNPMGQPCYRCDDYGCVHNFNDDNPELIDDWEYDEAGYPVQPRQ